MNYCFFPSLLVRTPLYSSDSYNTADHSQLLKSDVFRTALFLASKSFYDELEKKQFDFERLDDKQKHSVRKYMNRVSYRSTPFGLFSAFSLVNWSDQPDSKFILDLDPTALIQLDFSVLAKLWVRFLKDHYGAIQMFQPNQSIYFSKTDFRYIKSEADHEGQAHFSMITIAKNPLLKKLLHFCAKGKSFAEIQRFLLKETNSENEAADDFIRELIDQQIIVSDNSPNVTGKDYSELLLEFSEGLRQHANGELNVWTENLSGLIPALSATIKNLGQFLDNEKNFFYAVAKREVQSGGLASKYQQQLLEGIDCLNLMSSVPPTKDLQKFKKAFEEKYGSEEVPLLQVVDSQLGVGYGEFASIKSAYSFLNTNNQPEKSNLSQGDAREDLASLLLNAWHMERSGQEKLEIEITDLHLEALRSERKKGKLPPSISVVFRICGENLFIEDAGGTSALSLMGRFSCAPEVYSFARQIADLEQNLNPDIAFAEIAHICNHHSANINRRKHLREYEIPVLTNSTMEQEKQISLSDIMVSVVDDTVLLFSKKLRKNIIPRLSSAFNYTNNCFPIFRFLCDVQGQHLRTELSFSLPLLVPGLKFYPRVRYKSCVLQLAEWHIDGDELNFIHQADIRDAPRLLREFAGKKGLPSHCAYTNYDNFLVFDLDNNDDALFFLKEIKNKDKIVLREFPFGPTAGTSLLEQYVASLYLDEEVYKEEIYKRERKDASSGKKTDVWLYFKIYCHPLSSDTILCKFLFPLVNKCIKEGRMKEWFWVRYQDPEYHIRLRVKPGPGKQGELFEIFSSCLHRLISAKLIHRFQTDIYQPETERYSHVLLDQVEAVFNASSRMVSHFLKRKDSHQWKDEKVLIEGVTSLHKMLGYFGLTSDEIIEFCNVQFNRFFQEFSRPKNLKPEIEKLHKAFHADISIALKNKKDGSSLKQLHTAITQLLQRHRDKKMKNPGVEKLAADIIHMHINRLFSHDQRYFEMVVYYLLYRSLVTEKHKAKAAGN